MTDIRRAIEQLPEPEKSLNNALIEFYQTMKGLENDPERGGKQATKIIMTVSDIQQLLSGHSTKEPVAWLCEKGEGRSKQTHVAWNELERAWYEDKDYTTTPLVKK